MADCPFNSADENIADFIYRIGSQQQIIGNPADIPCMDYVNDQELLKAQETVSCDLTPEQEDEFKR